MPRANTRGRITCKGRSRVQGRATFASGRVERDCEATESAPLSAVCYKEVGTFTSPASTTPQTQDVALSNFSGTAPDFIIIWASRQTAAGTATRCLFSIGFGTSATNRASAAMNEDEALTSDEDRAHTDAGVIITTQSNDFSAATIFEQGDISALAADKFTIDWEVLDASAYRYHFAAFGGGNIEANVVTFVSQTADATAQNVPHGLAGIPTGVFGFSSHNIGAPPSIDGAGQADMSIFASDLTTDRWTGVSAAGGTARRGQLAVAAAHNEPSGIIEKSTITSADATNLEFTWELGDTAEYYYLLVVRGVDFEVGKFTTPATATTRAIPTGMEPELFFNWGWMDVEWPTPDAFGLDDVRLMFGASDGTNQASIGAFVQDTTGEADRFDSSTDCLRVYTHPAMALQEAATAAISGAIVTLTFSSAVAAANEFNYFTIGCESTGVGPDSLTGLVLWLDGETTVSTNGARQYTAANTEYHTIADTADHSVSGSFSISAMCYRDSTGINAICGKGPNSTAGEFQLFFNAGALDFRIWDGATSALVAGGSIGTGTWVHVLAEFDTDADTLTFWIDDGTPVQTTGVTIDPQDSTGTFQIGALGANNFPYDGRLARLGLWKRTLTAAERTYLCNSSQGRSYGSLGIAGTDGSALLTSLSGYWNLSESSGNAIDNHTTGNDLTDTNTVTAAAGPGNDANILDSDPVVSWLSREGHTKDFVQTTSTKRPSYVASAANGKPGVNFDGTDDLLELAEAHLATSVGTILIAFKADVESADEALISTGDEATALGVDKWAYVGNKTTSQGGNIGAEVAGTVNRVAGDDSTFGTAAGVLGISSDGSTWRVFLDGTEDTTLATVSGANTGDWFGDVPDADNTVIGALKQATEGNHFNGTILEIVAYERELLDAERQVVETYLANKYGT